MRHDDGDLLAAHDVWSLASHHPDATCEWLSESVRRS